MSQIKTRDSNIELLRILSMVMIIGHHFAVHGGFYFDSDRITGNMLFLQWLSLGGKIGVNLFVLISGYFLVTSPGLRLGRVVKFWLQVFFYSVVIYLLCALTGIVPFTGRELLRALFPILSGQWWFAGSYFVMYLLSPLVNRLLRGLSARKHLLLLGILAALWYVIPVLSWLPERLRDPVWFLFLYCIAGYLRLHGVAAKGRARTWLTLGVGALLLSFIWAVVLLSFRTGSQSHYETAYFNTWHPLMLLPAIGLFLGFAAMKPRHIPAVNAVAAAAFGIYLIHDSDHIRYPLWRGLLNCGAWRDSGLLIPYALAAIALVFGVCLALEWLRIRLLDGPFSAAAEAVEKMKDHQIRR